MTGGLNADRYFDAAGVRLRYVEHGEGPAVVLLHSYTSSIEQQWAAAGVLDALARRHRVIALDLRGHGRSGKPHEPACYGSEMALDVMRLLDHLGLRSAHVVGYSMGAHVTAQFVTIAPQRLRSAVLGGAAGRRGWSADDEAQAQREAAEIERGLLTSQVLRLWPGDQPLPGAAELAARAVLPHAGQDFRALAAIRRAGRAQIVSARALADAGVPLLGLVGSADPYRASFLRLRETVRELQIVTLDGATHADAPSHPGFVPAILSFLERHAD